MRVKNIFSCYGWYAFAVNASCSFNFGRKKHWSSTLVFWKEYSSRNRVLSFRLLMLAWIGICSSINETCILMQLNFYGSPMRFLRLLIVIALYLTLWLISKLLCSGDFYQFVLSSTWCVSTPLAHFSCGESFFVRFLLELRWKYTCVGLKFYSLIFLSHIVPITVFIQPEYLLYFF